MTRILGFDTETTGLKAVEGDKIIEIALLTYDSETRTLVDSFVTRIDPERGITAKAQQIHGIGYEELVGKPKFRDVVGEIEKRFTAADAVVAHNLAFDAIFLLCEFQACGVTLPNKPSVDTMAKGRWATFNGKLPKLMELCFALGVPYDKALAHSASYDVEVMMQCLWAGQDRGFFKMPASAKG